MARSRLIPWTIAAASLAGLVATSLLMAQRVAEFHEASPRQVYAFSAVDERSFMYSGRPVTLTPDTADPAAPHLVIDYGGDVLRLPVAIPNPYELPGLKSYEDWLRVLRFVPASGMDTAQFQRSLDQGVDRLAIVTRTPVQGVDARTWGSVWKKNWVFDFYELRPEGGFAHQRLKYPTTRGIAKPKEGELRENTWEFQAALKLMPQAGGVGPTHNFYGDALEAADWTLPAAAFCGLAACFAIAFAAAPARRALGPTPRQVPRRTPRRV
jgi:hypothetical protein